MRTYIVFAVMMTLYTLMSGREGLERLYENVVHSAYHRLAAPNWDDEEPSSCFFLTPECIDQDQERHARPEW
jgi:hypothetical protein